MTKQEFIKKSKELDNKIRSIKEEKRDLKEVYIDANKKYDSRQKVRVLRDGEFNRFMFIYTISASDDGTILYSYRKCKKDGTMSLMTDWLSWHEKIDPNLKPSLK